jgi:hypothetical protein
MGYHVAIIRTGRNEKTIRQDEIVSIVEAKFGFSIERDESGDINQVFREISGEEVLFFYDGTELWTKNPTELVLKIMIEIAHALGNEARVRGDEGETYESAFKTYTHPDDAHLNEEEKSKFDWAYWLPLGIKFLAASYLIYAVIKLIFYKYFIK